MSLATVLQGRDPQRPSSSADAADLELMRRAGSGDPEAQHVLIKRLMGRANRLAHALLRNREDAFDASQAALIGILRATSSFRGESSVECWADRIVVRTALRLSRRSRSNAVNELSDCLAASTSAGGEARLSAVQYLSRLPERQRTALLLRAGFGYSIEEISELTQSPENTVKDRLKRARTALRRQLDRERSSESGPCERRMLG
jgi:RNA polymerase sigma-70 factor, ECF subfamily